jgi:hypothetical protein
MKKSSQKLGLRRETVRQLIEMDLAHVIGANGTSTQSGDVQCPAPRLVPSSHGPCP